MTSLRSVAAIVGGIALFSLVLIVANSAGNAVLGSEPQWFNRSVLTQLMWLAWNAIGMVGAGHLTATVAPYAPRTHAILMGTLQSAFTLAAMFVSSDPMTPQWLWLSAAATSMPAAWAGARLSMRVLLLPQRD